VRSVIIELSCIGNCECHYRYPLNPILISIECFFFDFFDFMFHDPCHDSCHDSYHKIRHVFISEKYHPFISSNIQDKNLQYDEISATRHAIVGIQDIGCIGYYLVVFIYIFVFFFYFDIVFSKI